MAAKRSSARQAAYVKTQNQRPATQGGSLANMGDNCPTNGCNAPRGYYSISEANRGMLATGSTPLASTGTYMKAPRAKNTRRAAKAKGSRSAAAAITGTYGF